MKGWYPTPEPVRLSKPVILQSSIVHSFKNFPIKQKRRKIVHYLYEVRTPPGSFYPLYTSSAYGLSIEPPFGCTRIVYSRFGVGWTSIYSVDIYEITRIVLNPY